MKSAFFFEFAQQKQRERETKVRETETVTERQRETERVAKVASFWYQAKVWRLYFALHSSRAFKGLPSPGSLSPLTHQKERRTQRERERERESTRLW